MTAAPPVSLIIVSRGRRAALQRVVSALRFQTYQRFELIVVSDQADTSFAVPYGRADVIRHQQFSEPNISAARNIGLRMAGGEIVTFCDDDAVPDPTWLEHLIAPFSDTSVGQAGGFVRGRNGISFQWKAMMVDRGGEDHPLAVPTDAPSQIVAPSAGRFPRVQGTNCAFRHAALAAIGGFDEGFRFYLDETDVSMRLGLAGWATAIVPRAQVHHGYAASDQRTETRVPRTLRDIAVSKKRFLAKHFEGDPEPVLKRFRKDQQARLIRLMVSGRIEPRDVRRLRASLCDGLQQVPAELPQAAYPDRLPESFAQFNKNCTKAISAVASGLRHAGKAKKIACTLSDRGEAVQVFRLSPTTLFHHRFFDPRGFWVQAGGLFGKSRRNGRIFQPHTLVQRVEKEIERHGFTFPTYMLTIVSKNRNFVTQLTKTVGKEP